MDWEKMNFRTEKEGKGRRGRMPQTTGQDGKRGGAACQRRGKACRGGKKEAPRRVCAVGL